MNKPELSWITSPKGEPIPLFSMDEKSFPLHSKYNPTKEGVRLFNDCQSPDVVYVCLGLGMGYHLDFLMKERKNPFFIIEDSLSTSIFDENSSYPMEIRERVKKEGHFFTELDYSAFFSRLSSLLYRSTVNFKIKIISLPGYERFNPSFCASMREQIQGDLKKMAMDLATIRVFDRVWKENYRRNSLFLRNREKYHLCFPDFGGREVLVIAAGPSLNDSIDEIRGILRDRKPILLSTDTAIPCLVAHKIVPDYVITIDCQHFSLAHHQLVPTELRKKISLIKDCFASPCLDALYDRIFFLYPPHPEFVNPQKQLPCYDTGGNVTHSAVDIAFRSGATKIGVYGADFSYQLDEKRRLPYCSDTLYAHKWEMHQTKLSSIENSTLNMSLNEKSELQLNEYRENFLATFRCRILSPKNSKRGYYELR